MTRLEQLWPEPSEAVARLISDIAERLLAQAAEVMAGLKAASLQDPQYLMIADDPVLAEADGAMVMSQVKHWLTSSITNPGRRVPPREGSEMQTFARDVVLRGLVVDDIGGWRPLERKCWDWWLSACFEATNDLDQLRELCEISGYVLTTAMDDAMVELGGYVQQIKEELAGGSHLQRYAMVELLLHGADIATARAEAQLGYALTGSHVGAVVWVDSEQDATLLERSAEQVMRACGVRRRLTVAAGTTALWLWLPVATTPTVAALAERFRGQQRVRVAIGRPAPGIPGFRRTHSDATAAQRLLSRLGSDLSMVRYEDVHLVDLLAADVAAADRFVADVLGDFFDASPVLHRTVLTYVDEGLNRTSTAERLYTHRNTIDRRLVRVDELLPKPFAENPTEVTAALKLLSVRRGFS